MRFSIQNRAFAFAMLFVLGTFSFATANAYFINAAQCSTGQCTSISTSDSKLAVSLDTTILDSTLHCQGNSCTWVYDLQIDTVYSLSYTTTWHFEEGAICYSFFDSKNSLCRITVDSLGIWGYGLNAKPELVWGDTLAMPGITSQIHVRYNYSITEPSASTSYNPIYLYGFALRLIGSRVAQPDTVFGQHVKLAMPDTLSFFDADSLVPKLKGGWRWFSSTYLFYAAMGGGSTSYKNPSSTKLQMSLVFTADSFCVLHNDTAVQAGAIRFAGQCSNGSESIEISNLAIDPFGYVRAADTVCPAVAVVDSFLILEETGFYRTGFLYFVRDTSISPAITAAIPNHHNIPPGLRPNCSLQLSKFLSTYKLRFNVPNDGHAKLEISDLSGRHVANLIDSYLTAGNYEKEVPVHALSHGAYILSMQLDGRYVAREKVVLLR